MSNWLLKFKIPKSDGAFDWSYLTIYAKSYSDVMGIAKLLQDKIANSECVMIEKLL